MKVIGIDQSLTGTGVSVINDDKLEYSTVIKSKFKGVKRLVDIKNQLIKIYDSYRPDHIAMEGYGFMTRGRGFELGELGGVIKVTFSELGNPPIIVHPSHLKKFVTGKGNCDKSLVLMHIYKKYNIEFNDNNIADSYGIARLVLEIVLMKQGKRNRKDFNKEEWAVIKEYIK